MGFLSRKSKAPAKRREPSLRAGTGSGNRSGKGGGGAGGGRKPPSGNAPRRKAAPQRKRRSLTVTLLSWSLTAALWGMIIMAAATAYVFLTLDEKGAFKIPEREPGVMLLAADGSVLAERGSFFGDDVRLDELPSYLPQAIIAVEDRRFYSHFGLDPLGLARAMLNNIKAGRVVEGGSTLTQQLAKNLFLSPERSWQRKAQEAVLALWLENKFSKDEILQLYLNRIEFAAGELGVDKAAQKFFGHSAREVSLSEAAILAAVLKGTTSYNPILHPEAANRRAREVIKDMVRAGFITQAEADKATDAKTKVKATDYIPATQYIVDWINAQLPDLIGKLDESIVVETTIDSAIQKNAEKALRARLANEGVKRKATQGAVIVMEPRGAVVAMVGGRSYVKSQYNRAVTAKRQPGSAFKPFVYLTAIEYGMTPDTTEVDEPVTIGNWTPENYSRKYRGAVTLKDALSNSINTVAAKLAAQVGPDNVISTARRLGISSELQPNASIGLGTSEVSLLEMTTAYAPFANGGDAVTPFAVTRITTRDGKVLYNRRGGGLGRAIYDYDLGDMNTMLRAVVQEGTGKTARIEGQDVGGKTGTTQDYRDAWFIGYTDYLVAGVWIGNDDNSPTAKVTGGSIPAEVWHDIMAPAHSGLVFAPLPGENRNQYVGADSPYSPDFRPRSSGGIGDLLSSIFGGGSQPAQPLPPPGGQPAPDAGNGNAPALRKDDPYR